LKVDQPKIISTQYALIWFVCFWKEDFNVILSQSASFP